MGGRKAETVQWVATPSSRIWLRLQGGSDSVLGRLVVGTSEDYWPISAECVTREQLCEQVAHLKRELDELLQQGAERGIGVDPETGGSAQANDSARFA